MHLKKIIQYLSYLFVFFLPWQTRWIAREATVKSNVFEYGRISIYSFDVVFLIIVLFCLLHFILNKKKIKTSNNIPYVAALVIFVISLIVATDKFVSIYWSFRLIQAALLLWILKTFEISRIKTYLSFVFSMTFSAGLGIYQFLTQSTFANKWLGLAYHSASVSGDSVIEILFGRFLRAYGSLPHPNALGGFLIVSLIFLIILWQKNVKKVYVYPMFFIQTTALFFTFSRAAWLAYVLLIFICFYQIASKHIKKDTFNLIVISIFFLVFLSFKYLPLVETRLGLTSQPARLETKSNEQRLSGYSQAYKVFKKNPVFGVGIGNYTYVLNRLDPGAPAWYYQPVHNIYLLILVELGIFSSLILILFFFYHLKKKSINISLYLLPILFLFFFDHFWWTLTSGVLLTFISLEIMKNLTVGDEGLK